MESATLPVSATTLTWIYLSLGSSAILRHSAADNMPGDIPYPPMMSSLIACAGNILITLYYWTRYGFTGLRFRGASRLLIADMHIAKAELTCFNIPSTPAVLSVLANLMMAVPLLKIVGFTGLPWFCYMAAASTMLAAIVRLVVCWAATCPLSESQQHSLTDLHDDGALQTRSRVVDLIFRYCIFFQMCVWVTSCLPGNAILLRNILKLRHFVLGILYGFAAWSAKYNRLHQILSWTWTFTCALICGATFATSQHESNTSQHFAHCVMQISFIFNADLCLSCAGVMFVSPKIENFEPSLVFWITTGSSVFRKSLAWAFLVMHFATTLIYFVVLYDEKKTSRASFTDWFG
ncbi:hypothetical protein D6D01_10282 [Aureobasidium pullulans]|uniref:Transmembrane protein n=1 Tax=Aureobasidium pullulans TaxID=5580 RepID=A0A4S9JIN6_AURPU|nr:hypothetical protein D6D01_10282 [Aureobasidium pullulans]